MLDLSKKIISYVVVFSLVLSFSTVAFADDTESDLTGDTPVSSDTVTEADINEQLYILSKNVASLQASNSDVTYTTDDIYLLLQQMLNYNFNQQNASLTFRIYNALLQSNLNFTTLFTKIDSINSKLTNEDDTLNIYDLCGDMFEQVINHLTVSLGDNIYSITDVCLLIETQIDDIIDYLANIESMLATLNNTTSAINTLVNTISTIASNIAINTSNTVTAVNNNTTAINNLRDDFNNVTWLDLSIGQYGITRSISDIVYLENGEYNSGTYYFHFTNHSILNNNIIYRFQLPIFRSTPRYANSFIESVRFILADGTSYVPDYHIEYDILRNSVYIYFYNQPLVYSSNTNLFIELVINKSFILRSNYSFKYITDSYNDFYTIYEYLFYHKNNQVLNKFEYLYASDDLIAAKDAQQPLEDQVLQDFTGNGSASAKLSDAASAKDASSALQSGLNTGYSASDALSVFNSFQASDYGFFAWFSPENATYFNNDSNRNILKSNMGVNDDYTSIVWTDSVPDVITDIDNDYSRGMK